MRRQRKMTVLTTSGAFHYSKGYSRNMENANIFHLIKSFFKAISGKQNNNYRCIKFYEAINFIRIRLMKGAILFTKELMKIIDED